jgi:glycosyltransferase involved in cell wall biosynthesis
VAHPGAELYGSDRVFLESVRALRPAAEVVVTLPVDGPLRRLLEDEGVTVVVHRAPVLRKSAARPLGLLRLAGTTVRSLPGACRLIRSAGRDGIYVSTLTLPGWLVLGRLLGRRVVCHVHEAESTAPRWLRWLLALPVRAAGTVLVNSRFSESVLLASAPSLTGRTTVLGNPVPGPVAPEPARARLTGPVRLLFVGRLSPRKGPQVAVLALAELVRRGVDARLALLGSAYEGYEWFERELEELTAREGLTDRVDVLGFRADVWPHLQECDLVLVPSQVDEPFGNTAVEAVLAARPVVVSATSGLLEAAQGYSSGRLVAPSDPGAWADAVEELVGRWPATRREAAADAVTAAERHAPERYAPALRRLVLPLVAPVLR